MLYRAQSGNGKDRIVGLGKVAELLRPERVKLNMEAAAKAEVKKPSIRFSTSAPAQAAKPAPKPVVKSAPPASKPAKPKIRIK